MANSYRKDFIGEEDIAFDVNRTNETFERQTSTGLFTSITKINANHIPVSDELIWDDAETVQEMLALAKAKTDQIEEVLDVVIILKDYIGAFNTPADLISANPEPNEDDFAFVDSTGTFFHWDQSKVIPAWQEIYKGFPAGRQEVFPDTVHTIDWEDGDVFDLGLLVQGVTLEFTNVLQSQEITITFTTTEFLTATLPISVTPLDGGSVTASSFNSVTIKAVNGAALQEGRFHTDKAPVDDGDDGDDGGGGIIPADIVEVDDADHVVLDIDVIAGRIKVINTTAVRTITLDVELIESLKPFSVQNDGVTSTSIIRIVVSNTGTMTIDGGYVDLYLSPGELVTFEGDSVTNISVIARP